MNTEAATPAEEIAVAPEAALAPRRSLVVVIVIAVVALAALAGAASLLGPRLLPSLFGRAKADAPAKVEASIKATVPLGPIVVNMPGETRRYLRLAVSLGVPGAKDAKEVEEARAQLLDLVITVVSASDVEALTSDAGRASLKEKLLARIHEELHLEQVGRVYFTEFVVQ
jgi:flagellar basal body-associated protein FliL